jgi:hypothetical protein
VSEKGRQKQKEKLWDAKTDAQQIDSAFSAAGLLCYVLFPFSFFLLLWPSLAWSVLALFFSLSYLFLLPPFPSPLMPPDYCVCTLTATALCRRRQRFLKLGDRPPDTHKQRSERGSSGGSEAGVQAVGSEAKRRQDKAKNAMIWLA